jgi:hypothetical protein
LVWAPCRAPLPHDHVLAPSQAWPSQKPQRQGCQKTAEISESRSHTPTLLPPVPDRFRAKRFGGKVGAKPWIRNGVREREIQAAFYAPNRKSTARIRITPVMLTLFQHPCLDLRPSLDGVSLAQNVRHGS